MSSTQRPVELSSDGVIFRVTVQPKSTWNTKLHITPVTGQTVHPPKFTTAAGNAMRHYLQEWIKDAPTFTSHPQTMQLYKRSLIDVAALRLHSDTLGHSPLPPRAPP